MIQTFWSKHKVLVFGIVSAILTAIAPIVFAAGSHQYDIKALIVVGVIGGSTFLGREARGKNWTIVGQVAAALIVMASAYQHDLDLGRMVMAGVFSVFSVPIPPLKAAEYEHAPTIVQAKEEALVIKEDNKLNQ